uniref:Tubulin, gamma complex component 2 n=1 Tax=Mus musculus TaxID=10090 RepID=A0A1B0GS25_MOUSE
MSEFRIHHDVNELLSLLRIHGGDGAEVYIDLLQKNRTPYVTTTVSAHSAKIFFVSGLLPLLSYLHACDLRSKLQNFLELLRTF